MVEHSAHNGKVTSSNLVKPKSICEESGIRTHVRKHLTDLQSATFNLSVISSKKTKTLLESSLFWQSTAIVRR